MVTYATRRFIAGLAWRFQVPGAVGLGKIFGFRRLKYRSGGDSSEFADGMGGCMQYSAYMHACIYHVVTGYSGRRHMYDTNPQIIVSSSLQARRRKKSQPCNAACVCASTRRRMDACIDLRTQVRMVPWHDCHIDRRHARSNKSYT